MEIELTGFATVSADVRTVGDLYEFAQILESRNIDPESELDWSRSRVFVDLKVHDIDWIECGDHRPRMLPNGEWESWSDVILITHGHDSEISGQMTTDEVIEHQPTDYDWPARDRAKRMASEAYL